MEGHDEDPRRIGPYDVLAKLAVGGVGAVYLGRRRGPSDFRRMVAIKRLHPQFASDPEFVTMFRDEARLAARIHHANVVSIVELGEDDHGHYVVMDYVEGANLGTFAHHAGRVHKVMPRAIALRIVLDALSGLAAAHDVEDDDGVRVDLVHRDVSPQNILVGTDGVSRLGDFGIARASALRDFETRGAALKGKLEYMAPEQIDGKEVDRTTDLFATGIVLWEVLAGQRLFPSGSQVKTIQRICFDPIPSPRTIVPSLSQELERICLHALERTRSRRYASAAAFAEDLERAARTDCGIATQREVAACLSAVVGDSLLRVKNLLAQGAPAELGKTPGPSTQSLPKSDPLIPIMPASQRDMPPPSVDTVPYGDRVPKEVMAEAQRSADTEPKVSTDPIGVPNPRRTLPHPSSPTYAAVVPPAHGSSPNHPGIARSAHPSSPGFGPPSNPAISQSPMSAPPSLPVSSAHPSSIRGALTSSGAPAPNRIPVGPLVVVAVLAVGIGGFGIVRLARGRSPGPSASHGIVIPVSSAASVATAAPERSTAPTSAPITDPTPPAALELPSELPAAASSTPPRPSAPAHTARAPRPPPATSATSATTATSTSTATPTATAVPTPSDPPPGLPAEL